MANDSAGPWHQGERALQARLGVAEQMKDVGSRVIRDYMPDQHRTFYAQVPFLVTSLRYLPLTIRCVMRWRSGIPSASSALNCRRGDAIA